MRKKAVNMFFYQSETYQSDLKLAATSIVNAENLYGKTVLVTGASGMIGSFIVDTLVYLNRHFQAGIRIVALGRNQESLQTRFQGHDEQVVYLVQDVSAPLADTGGIDFIIHAASNANPQAYSSDPVGTISANLSGTENLLQASQKTGAKFIYISTGEVYGELDDTCLPFSEEMAGYIDSMNVRSCYSLSKKMAENLCIAYGSQYGVKTAIARLSHVFGANFTTKDNRVSAAFFRDALSGKAVILKSTGQHLRSYTYLSDCVAGILSITSQGESGEAYNVTKTDNAITMADFAKTIADVAGVKFEFQISDIETAQKTPISKAVLSDEKLRGVGFLPTVSVASGVKRILDTLREVTK
jgi:nucleoside-diphosphate-sugar epimerase